jgi:hypothetical protein
VKTPPTEVTEPLVQLLQYLIWAAGRLAYARNQSPHETDAGQSIVVTLISAVFASAATGIAAALLTF